MRYFLAITLSFCFLASYAQKPCYQHSRLFLFDKNNEPRLFTDTLGRHPQFPFLQRVNGITTPERFIHSIRDTLQRRKYSRTFKAFDLLLRNTGFWRGYKELNAGNIKKGYITPGTLGNLGFYDRSTDIMNYLYVKLNPAGESPDGVEAWKLINKKGCFIYILFTCGNAFYPNGEANFSSAGASEVQGNAGNGNGSGCCHTLTVQPSGVKATPAADSLRRPFDLRMNYYRALLTPSRQRGKLYDTAVTLVRYKDTVFHIRDRLIIPVKLDLTLQSKTYIVCRDSTVSLPAETGDRLLQTDSTLALHYILSDTVYEKLKTTETEDCGNHWEVTLEAGKSWNSIPRLDDPAQHSQTNGSQFTGTLEISRILAPWFQLGVSAAYIVLTYQDDINYPGSTAGTYNTIYLGKPIVPIQLFGKFNFGKPVGFQSSIQLGFGYSVPTNGKIENNGIILSTKPNLKGDFTASLKFGIAYYFTCHIGVGATFTGEYFNNKSDLIAYSLYALPVQGGLRVRF